ncbi:MAG: TRAP transporter small permease subunit [Ancalomicrobiaceae bacterium]|nr:TRAP transporter small permease subunit [Ancalomicrobiaceae bacterium]
MSAPRETVAVPLTGLSRHLMTASKGFALAGGVIFIGMVCLSVVSIVGRKLWSAPIEGDIELLQMGTGIAAATFFPYCTLANEHLRVEFFTDHLPARIRARLDGLANLMLALAMALLTWRSTIQAFELYDAGEVTVMRNIEVWIPVALMVPSLALTTICALDRAVHNFTLRSSAL